MVLEILRFVGNNAQDSLDPSLAPETGVKGALTFVDTLGNELQPLRLGQIRQIHLKKEQLLIHELQSRVCTE